MSVLIIALLVLAAVSLGLRTTSFLGARMHPMLRMAIALVAGALLSLAFLELCDSYRVFEFGLGLLISLSPVGVFDLVKWWFLRPRQAQTPATDGSETNRAQRLDG